MAVDLDVVFKDELNNRSSSTFYQTFREELKLKLIDANRLEEVNSRLSLLFEIKINILEYNYHKVNCS